MNRMKRVVLSGIAVAALALCVSAAAAPEDTALAIDPAQTKVEFTLGDVLHTVHGAFKLKRGTLLFDPSTGHAAGEMAVDAASGDSGTAAQDNRMSKEILESAKYPEIVFRPDRVEGTIATEGKSQVKLHGMFLIHGSDHEIVMQADVEAHQGQYSATLTFIVPYVKWGMKNPSVLMLRVKDEVAITIHTVAKPAK